MATERARQVESILKGTALLLVLLLLLLLLVVMTAAGDDCDVMFTRLLVHIVLIHRCQIWREARWRSK